MTMPSMVIVIFGVWRRHGRCLNDSRISGIGLQKSQLHAMRSRNVLWHMPYVPVFRSDSVASDFAEAVEMDLERHILRHENYKGEKKDSFRISACVFHSMGGHCQLSWLLTPSSFIIWYSVHETFSHPEAVSPLQIRSCSLASQKIILDVLLTLLGNTCPADFSLALLPAVPECVLLCTSHFIQHKNSPLPLALVHMESIARPSPHPTMARGHW